MDDNTMQVEFPVGENGMTVTLGRPTDGQIFVLTVSRKPTENSSGREKLRFTEKVIGVLEALAGLEQWSGIESALLTGQLAPADLLSLFNDVLSFDWDNTGTEPDLVPAGEDGPEPVKRPAPRIVRGA